MPSNALPFMLKIVSPIAHPMKLYLSCAVEKIYLFRVTAGIKTVAKQYAEGNLFKICDQPIQRKPIKFLLAILVIKDK